MLALAHAFVLPWYQERYRIASIGQVRAQIFTEPRDRYLVRQFAGDRLFQRAVYVHLDDIRVTDEWVENLQGLQHVEVLSICRSVAPGNNSMFEPTTTLGQPMHLDRLANIRRSFRAPAA